MTSRINWKLFHGSTHCSDGLYLFARDEEPCRNFKQFEEFFLPHMKEQAKEVRKMRKVGLKESRRRAGIAYWHMTGQSAKV